MAFYQYYRCPDCGGTFRWLHHPSDSPPPNRCELCKAWMNLDVPEPVFVPLAPGIRKSPYVKSVDQTYRAMESASIDRAREAADIAGVSEAEMSHLKITNMVDPTSLREGDVSAITPSQDNITKFMQSNPGIGGGYNPLNVGGAIVTGEQLAAAAHQGPHPHSGDTIRAATASSHRDRAWQMQRAGEMGRYTGKG
jgi:hypothetical protein